ncbi:hypothetical protein ILFOPFJJ_06316 [Ensifer psoraleae]|nr:hypothetical protein [Sinorhizobium psoraleae]
MGYLGLVPGERSTGETVKRIGITKAGNGRVRALLVECAWTYRYPPRIGRRKLYRLQEVSSAVREIAWKAQARLTARYRMLSARGKKSTVVCTAVARELVGFMWAVRQRGAANPVTPSPRAAERSCPCGIAPPNGHWAARCLAGDAPAIATADIIIDRDNPARPWRRKARSDLYAPHQVNSDPRATAATCFDE